MDTQEFWMPVRYIPDNEKPKTNDACIKILIPKKCNTCCQELITTCGSFVRPSGLKDCCSHFPTYLEVWLQRIKNDLDNNILLHCHKCNMPNNYAIPNAPDEKYVCYECRLTQKIRDEINTDFNQIEF